jgi:hypothetical protein
MSFINRAAPPVKTVMAALVLAIVGGLGIFGASQIAFGSGPSDPSFVPHANSCVSRWGFIRVVSDTANCSKWEKPLLIASEEKVDDLFKQALVYVNGATTTTVQRVTEDFDTDGSADRTVVADCGAGNHATGGGGTSSSTSETLIRSFPSDAGGAFVPDDTVNPRYWAVTWHNTSTNLQTRRAFALCVPDALVP